MGKATSAESSARPSQINGELSEGGESTTWGDESGDSQFWFSLMLTQSLVMPWDSFPFPRAMTTRQEDAGGEGCAPRSRELRD